MLTNENSVRNSCLGVCRDSPWLEEYLKIIEIDDHFSNESSFFAFFILLICLDHIPFGLLLFGPYNKN